VFTPHTLTRTCTHTERLKILESDSRGVENLARGSSNVLGCSFTKYNYKIQFKQFILWNRVTYKFRLYLKLIGLATSQNSCVVNRKIFIENKMSFTNQLIEQWCSMTKTFFTQTEQIIKTWRITYCSPERYALMFNFYHELFTFALWLSMVIYEGMSWSNVSEFT
jgi:hypothetical protein